MSEKNGPIEMNSVNQGPCGGCSSIPQPEAGLSRRHFLQAMGAAGLAMGGLAVAAANVCGATAEPVPAEQQRLHQGVRGVAPYRGAGPGLPAR